MNNVDTICDRIYDAKKIFICEINSLNSVVPHKKATLRHPQTPSVEGEDVPWLPNHRSQTSTSKREARLMGMKPSNHSKAPTLSCGRRWALLFNLDRGKSKSICIGIRKAAKDLSVEVTWK